MFGLNSLGFLIVSMLHNVSPFLDVSMSVILVIHKLGYAVCTVYPLAK